MATNSKKVSKPKPGAKKNAVQSKNVSKASGKPVKKTAPKKAAPVLQEKKLTEAGKAFDKKMEEMAQTSTAAQKTEGRKKSFSKTPIVAIIVIIIAALVYFLYPWKKTPVKEQVAPREPAPSEPETKTVEPALEAPQKQEAPKSGTSDVTVYRVKYKDQLTEISKQYYGTTKEWHKIYEANKDKIKNPNLIFPGQELTIPKDEKKD